MGLLSGVVGATLRVFIRELRDTKQVLKDGIDTYRRAHGLPLLYADDPKQEPLTLGEDNPLIGSGDFLTAWMLEELAHDHNIKVTPDLNLEALARERGWVDTEGKFLLLPVAMAGMSADQDDVLALLSAKVLG